jgi:hypothetical protein
MQQIAQESVSQAARCYSPIDLQSYSTDLASSNFHLFVLLKQHLGGSRLHKNKEEEMAVCKLLQIRQPDFYSGGTLNSCQDGTDISMCSEIMLKNSDISEQQMTYI